jgi:hypothetical protein
MHGALTLWLASATEAAARTFERLGARRLSSGKRKARLSGSPEGSKVHRRSAASQRTVEPGRLPEVRGCGSQPLGVPRLM